MFSEFLSVVAERECRCPRRYAGAIDVIRRTYVHEGVLGFYKGLLASIARVTPATMCTFVVYEHVSHAVAERARFD